MHPLCKWHQKSINNEPRFNDFLLLSSFFSSFSAYWHKNIVIYFIYTYCCWQDALRKRPYKCQNIGRWKSNISKLFPVEIWEKNYQSRFCNEMTRKGKRKKNFKVFVLPRVANHKNERISCLQVVAPNRTI